MKIKKTVGVANADNCNDRGYVRKDYIIHTECGNEFLAKAKGTKGYECNGVSFESLKVLKHEIIGNQHGIEYLESEGSGFDTRLDTENMSPTWDCVHPCALLIRCGNSMGLSHKALETLDKYGWLTEEGLPDLEKVDKEFKRVYG